MSTCGLRRNDAHLFVDLLTHSKSGLCGKVDTKGQTSAKT